MRLSNALFALPTLFTLTSMFFGLLSIVSSYQGDYGSAALAIMFAIVFDSIDGRVARLTRTQSKFGIQIDSLADVVSFGVAPTVLVYLAYLHKMVMWGVLDLGLVAAFLYLAAGAIRLARYNVDAEKKPGTVKQFIGLPIPGGAGVIAGLVIGLSSEGLDLAPVTAAILMFCLAFLMVSRVKYRKNLDLRSIDTIILLALLLVAVVVTLATRPAYALFTMLGFYVLVGLIEVPFRIILGLLRKIGIIRKIRIDESSDRNLPSGR